MDAAVAAAKTEHEGVASYLRRREFFKERASCVKELLQKRIDDEATGDVAAAVARFDDLAGGLADATAVRLVLARIEGSLLRDPGSAIGKAKNLIEATARAVLDEQGESYNDRDEVNRLVHAAMQALGIDRNSVAAHDVDLANVLQRLNSLTIALADLRNHAGDAHGASAPPTTILAGSQLLTHASGSHRLIVQRVQHERTPCDGRADRESSMPQVEFYRRGPLLVFRVSPKR